MRAGMQTRREYSGLRPRRGRLSDEQKKKKRTEGERACTGGGNFAASGGQRYPSYAKGKAGKDGVFGMHASGKKMSEDEKQRVALCPPRDGRPGGH